MCPARSNCPKLYCPLGQAKVSLNEVPSRGRTLQRGFLEALTEVSSLGNPSATNCLGNGHFATSRSLPSLPCFSASRPTNPHLSSQRRRSKSQRTTVPSSGVLSTCLASAVLFSAPTTSPPATCHQLRSEVPMTRLLDWDYEVKPARTMCHGKSGLDPPSPSMSQAGRVKPVERERRSPQSDRKRNSLASYSTPYAF
jgi:hypothetical protein